MRCQSGHDRLWQGSIIMVIEASNLTAACSWVLGGSARNFQLHGESSVIGSWRVPRFTPRSVTMEQT